MDYDERKGSDEATEEEVVSEIESAIEYAPKIDEDESDLADAYQLSDDDTSHEELDVEVVPKSEDEFTCSVCHLLLKNTMLAKHGQSATVDICVDCV
jgi:hypothetical protein